MTAQDRCTDTTPHRPHRAQYGPFGVKDCPGVPLQHLLAEPTNTEETPADAARRLAGELEQLRYERKLLGAARTVLDQLADAGTRPTPGLISQAADMAQRIVDEIGHPATDEPALGPSHREQFDRLHVHLAMRGIDVGHLQSPFAIVDAALTAIDELRAHPAQVLDLPAPEPVGGPALTAEQEIRTRALIEAGVLWQRDARTDGQVLATAKRYAAWITDGTVPR